MPVVLELVSNASFQQLPISTFIRTDTFYKSFVNQGFQSSLNATVVQTCLLGQFCPASRIFAHSFVMLQLNCSQR